MKMEHRSNCSTTSICQSHRLWVVTSTTEPSSTCSCQVGLLPNFLTICVFIASIKWALKFPLRFAISEPSTKYVKEVEDKTLAFLSHSLKFDLSGGDNELNLDMTLEEAEFLALASDEIKAKAESGELLALTTWMREFQERKQILLNTIYDKLDRTLQQCDLMENEIIEDLQEESEELQSLRTSSDYSIINDLSGIREGGRSFENLVLVESFVA